MAVQRMPRQSRISYLRLAPGATWEEDADEARFRLETRIKRTVQIDAVTTLEARTEDGWRAVDISDARLSGVQRGLVWEGWMAARSGTSFVCYEGVRAIDPSLASTLLDGLVVLDHDGQELGHAELAGLRFALGVADAKVFAARVTAAGGEIRQVEPQLSDIGRHAETIERAARHLALVCAQAQAAVADAARGVMRQLHTVGEVADEAWTSRSDAQRAWASLEPALRHMHAEGASMSERVVATRRIEAARAELDLVEERYALYRRLDEQAVAMLANVRAGERPQADAAFTDALAALAAHLAGRGQEVELRGGVLRITTPEGVVEIAERTRVRTRVAVPAAPGGPNSTTIASE